MLASLKAFLKAFSDERINMEARSSSIPVVSNKKHLVLPHVNAPDIRFIDWVALKKQGFKGVVFEKRTLIVPYSLNLWEPLIPFIEACKSVFGGNIAVYSNFEGHHEYDPDGSKARELERMIDITVIRHGVKKPTATSEEIETHFGCDSSELIMVGDRPFINIVFGNRNGFLTVLTKPFTAEEFCITKLMRKAELSFVNQCLESGITPATHKLFPDGLQCVIDLPRVLNHSVPVLPPESKKCV